MPKYGQEGSCFITLHFPTLHNKILLWPNKDIEQVEGYSDIDDSVLKTWVITNIFIPLLH